MKFVFIVKRTVSIFLFIIIILSWGDYSQRSYAINLVLTCTKEIYESGQTYEDVSSSSMQCDPSYTDYCNAGGEFYSNNIETERCEVVGNLAACHGALSSRTSEVRGIYCPVADEINYCCLPDAFGGTPLEIMCVLDSDLANQMTSARRGGGESLEDILTRFDCREYSITEMCSESESMCSFTDDIGDPRIICCQSTSGGVGGESFTGGSNQEFVNNCDPCFKLKKIIGGDFLNTVKYTDCRQNLSDDEKSEQLNCEQCLFSTPGEFDSEETGLIWTEIGCVDTSPVGIITRIFQIGLGLLGGVGILRVIQIAVVYQSGDQEKIAEAQEMVVSLLAGMILMIAGITFLQFVGVNILGLPEGFLGR